MISKKVYIHPASCPKAKVDLEKIASLIVANGGSLQISPEQADFGIVFACGFIDDAKLESIEDILELAELKKEHKLDHVVVIGCMPQKYGKDLARDLDEVDAFVGMGSLDSLVSILDAIGHGETKRLWVEGQFGDFRTYSRVVLDNASWTRSLMICDGCDNHCSYCSIPQMRGSLRSRNLEDIIAEADLLVEQGAKELVVAGQDTASYGKDIGSSLEKVARALAERYPNCWIRIAYANPDNLKPDIAQIIGTYPNVCNYLDIPIQHASPRVLEAMGRSGDVAKLEDLIMELRARIPDIALRTSVIVGFPGETEKEFQDLLRFLGKVRFDLVGAFIYSPQPGTPAASLPDQVPDSIKEERLIEVIALQHDIALEKMHDLIGEQVEVLIEERQGEFFQARTQYDMREVDRIVLLEARDLEPGRFALARIETAYGYYGWKANLINMGEKG